VQEYFPVDYSHLSANALARQISAAYGLDIAWMKFYCGGFNDTYKLQATSGEVYYFRVYRPVWRTLNDIQYEVEALNHLKIKGFPAIRILHRLDGSQLSSFNAPEGMRYGILSGKARGQPISYEADAAGTSYRYGRYEAMMHAAMADFHTESVRRSLDLHFLTESVLENAEPFLAHRPADWAYLQGFSKRIKEILQGLPMEALPHGFCHGDLQGYHCNVAEDGALTFFDFDGSGPGPIAYDLGVFRWCGRLEEQEEERWEHFLRGYQEVRPLTELEIKAIPAMVACRYLWHISVHTLNAPDWGIDWLGDEYFDNRINTLKKLEEDYAGLI
jgi:Ser/Thr protein kinase RdoA (MazF antagonist)